MSTATEITLYDRIQDPVSAAERMGASIAKSGLFGVQKLEAGTVLALACMSEKKSPFSILREYHITDDGKLAARADSMLAKFRAAGGRVKWKQFDDKAAIGLWTWEGETTEISFTIEDAKKAELIRPKSGWVKNPDAMLRARCIAKAVRMLAPEVIVGIMAVEEIEDEAPTKEIKLRSSAPASEKTKTEDPQSTEKVIDVAVVEPSKESAQTASQPVTEQTQQVAPTEPASTASQSALTKAEAEGNGLLTIGTVAAIQKIVGDLEQTAMEWLTVQNWITGGDIRTLKVHRAQQIIDKSTVFLDKLKTFKAKSAK